MADLPDDASIETEFDVFAARAGLQVPPERRSAMLTGFREIRQLVASMRQERSAADEPAPVHSLATIDRSL